MNEQAKIISNDVKLPEEFSTFFAETVAMIDIKYNESNLIDTTKRMNATVLVFHILSLMMYLRELPCFQ